jgi:hypothetical protein
MQWFAGMVQLETDQTLKRKSSATARSQLKTMREAKWKKDIPVFADIENILLEYGISATAYHGGKLNDVDCRELIVHAKPIWSISNNAYSLSHIQDNALMI